MRDLLEGALDSAGIFRYKDQYGTIRPQGVPCLRDVLMSLVKSEGTRIALDMPWEFELVDVVVPTDQEWATVGELNVKRINLKDAASVSVSEVEESANTDCIVEVEKEDFNTKA